MATIREGRAAVLVVDTQAGVLREAWDSERIVRSVSRVVDRARSKGIPVIWVQHADEELAPGSADWQWADPLAPSADEAVVAKGHNSAFESTTLDDELARLGISRIVLLGAATNWCVRATAYGALDRGYDLALVADAHTTERLDPGDGDPIEARDIIRDLNATMTWLSYPGRQTTTVMSEEVFLGEA